MTMSREDKEYLHRLFLIILSLCSGLMMGYALTAKYHDSDQWNKGYLAGQQYIVNAVRALDICQVQKNLNEADRNRTTTPGQTKSETTPRN